jgi:hypothetical protein
MPETPLVDALHGFVDPAYPGIEIWTEPYADDPSRTAIFFRHPSFAALYPQQRYHRLIHHIPQAFFDEHLANTVWYEMAPGESPQDLQWPDEELIADIEPDVMMVLEKSGFPRALDLAFCPRFPWQRAAQCHGDYRVSKSLLPKHGFAPEEHFDVFHVLMARGGWCDCEILYNAVEESRLKARHWQARGMEQGAANLHRGPRH